MLSGVGISVMAVVMGGWLVGTDEIVCWAVAVVFLRFLMASA